VLEAPVDFIVGRHRWLCGNLANLRPPGLNLAGARVCEAGPGDCLATAAWLLGQGAAHVDLVELEPPAVNAKAVAVLDALRAEGLALSPEVLTGGAGRWELNRERVTYHQTFMERCALPQPVAFIFSTFVLEHVEDFAGFYGACHRHLQPGGWMLHVVDLGGHGEFEDPLPPLEFQRYPDWLYGWMYPRYHRATRRTLTEHLDAVRSAGFALGEVHVLRRAEADYVRQLQPQLRPALRRLPEEELGVIEFAFTARRLDSAS
jgi:SAM-dependent methyltransferase